MISLPGSPKSGWVSSPPRFVSGPCRARRNDFIGEGREVVEEETITKP